LSKHVSSTKGNSVIQFSSIPAAAAAAHAKGAFQTPCSSAAAAHVASVPILKATSMQASMPMRIYSEAGQKTVMKVKCACSKYSVHDQNSRACQAATVLLVQQQSDAW
jgi:hypothetical protein